MGETRLRKFDHQKPLIFIHVPKSAGSAVRDVVESWYPNRFHRHYFNETTAKMPELLPLESPEFLENPPVIYGHFNKLRGFGIEDYYPEVSQFVTILRDPFETVISHYFFVRKASKDWKDQSRVPTEGLENHIETAEPNILNHFPREMNLGNFKDIIEEFFVEIGITEKLPYSLEKISRKLDEKFDSVTLKMVNVTERDQPLPEIYRDQFSEKYPLEHAVYEFAKSRIAVF